MGRMGSPVCLGEDVDCELLLGVSRFLTNILWMVNAQRLKSFGFVRLELCARAQSE